MIIRNASKCYGCRTCELICSFHHKKVFSQVHSSIQVHTDMRTGVITWDLLSTCDSCKDEGEALCVKYCPYNALREVKVYECC